MKYELRNYTYNDTDFILELKEYGMKWYIEKIYGWDKDVQKEKTVHELDRHINDMKVIVVDNKDIGITTFYKENDAYVVGLTLIHPDYQSKGIATKLLSGYIKKAKDENKRIITKAFKENRACDLYERLGFNVEKEDNTHKYFVI